MASFDLFGPIFVVPAVFLIGILIGRNAPEHIHVRAERDAYRDMYLSLKASIRIWNMKVDAAQSEKFRAHAAKTASDGQAHCWEVLGIAPTRDKKTIMAAFRKKAQTAHPDKGGSPAAFQQLYEARITAMENAI